MEINVLIKNLKHTLYFSRFIYKKHKRKIHKFKIRNLKLFYIRLFQHAKDAMQMKRDFGEAVFRSTLN